MYTEILKEKIYQLQACSPDPEDPPKRCALAIATAENNTDCSVEKNYELIVPCNPFQNIQEIGFTKYSLTRDIKETFKKTKY